MPTTPVNCAGIRLEPPSSVPSAANAIPSATATAEPALEPPGRAGPGGIVRVLDLAGLAAGADAVVGEVVGRGLSQHDRPGRAEPRHFERVAPHRLGKDAAHSALDPVVGSPFMS